MMISLLINNETYPITSLSGEAGINIPNKFFLTFISSTNQKQDINSALGKRALLIIEQAGKTHQLTGYISHVTVSYAQSPSWVSVTFKSCLYLLNLHHQAGEFINHVDAQKLIAFYFDKCGLSHHQIKFYGDPANFLLENTYNPPGNCWQILHGWLKSWGLNYITTVENDGPRFHFFQHPAELCTDLKDTINLADATTTDYKHINTLDHSQTEITLSGLITTLTPLIDCINHQNNKEQGYISKVNYTYQCNTTNGTQIKQTALALHPLKHFKPSQTQAPFDLPQFIVAKVTDTQSSPTKIKVQTVNQLSNLASEINIAKSTPYNDHTYHVQKNDEIVVTFLNNNPKNPIMIGSHFNQQNKNPINKTNINEHTLRLTANMGLTISEKVAKTKLTLANNSQQTLSFLNTDNQHSISLQSTTGAIKLNAKNRITQFTKTNLNTQCNTQTLISTNQQHYKGKTILLVAKKSITQNAHTQNIQAQSTKLTTEGSVTCHVESTATLQANHQSISTPQSLKVLTQSTTALTASRQLTLKTDKSCLSLSPDGIISLSSTNLKFNTTQLTQKGNLAYWL